MAILQTPEATELANLRKRIAELEAKGIDCIRENERELLKICNSAAGINDLIYPLTHFFQKLAACETVGVRLHKGDDSPYYGTCGFPKAFAETERSLCTSNWSGIPLRDSDGTPIPECMCSNIICNRFDPTLPFFTANGSFWTNSTTDLLASSIEADRQAHPLKLCNSEGFESVALIPLRIQEKISGLFQFSDHQKNRFSLQLILQLEELISYVSLILDKRLTDENLRQSEQLLNMTQHLTKSGGWSWNVANQTMTWTKETYHIHEHEPDTSTSKSPDLIDLSLACYTPEDRPKILAAFRRCAESGEPYDLEFPFNTHKGRRLWIRTTAEAVWQNGRIVKVIGNIVDITERKQSELRLRENEQALQAILNASPESIFLMATDGTVIAANDALADRLKIPNETLIGSNLYTYLPPELAASRRQHLQNAIDSGKPYYFVDRRGNSIIEHHIFPIVEETGQIKRLAIFGMDCTDCERKNEHLRIYHDIVSSTPDGIAFLDKNYRYVIVNDAYEGFSGVNREKFIGLTVAEYLGNEVFEMYVKPHFDRCLRGETVSYQEWFDYPTLGRRFMDIRYYPYIDTHKRIAGVVAASRDITRRQKDTDLLAARLRLSEASAQLNFDELLVSCLDEAENLTDSRIGFLHLYDEDTESILLQAWSSATTSTFCMTEGKGLHYNFESAGVWADCIRQRKVIVHNDYAGLPHKKGLPAGHATVTREMVVPVLRNGRIMAILGLGNKIGEYDEKDIELAMNIANLTWDIILRKQAEDALHESENKFRTLATLAPVGIYLTSPEGQCQYANNRWCEMAGMTQEEALGKGWIAGLHPDDRGMVFDAWQRMVQSEAHWGLEYRFLTPKGTTTWVYGLASPQRDDTGRIIRYIGINTDITDKKATEHSLKASLAEKEVLLREVHHRVKNNMAAIIGLFDLQRQIMHDQGARDVMAELSSRVRAMSLVHEKLYRSDSLAHIDFQDYLKSLISHLRTSFGSPFIRCEISSLGVEMPLDLAVPCGMIISELVTNALKYAFPLADSKTADRVDCILVCMCHDQETYTLSVADNGIGLPPGFDLQSARTLGLTLVRMLGEHQLGGRYEIDQRDGIRFTLTFTTRNGRKEYE